MKKIFAIILAVLMVFSMSATAFAGFTSAPKEDKVEPEVVNVTVTLKEGFTPISDLEEFEIHQVVGKEDEIIKGRIFEVDFTISNDTKDIVYVDEVLTGFNLSVVEASTEKQVEFWEGAEDKGFGNKDLSKISIDPKEEKTVTYKIYAITEKSVVIYAVYEENSLNIEKEKAIFTLVIEEEPSTNNPIEKPEDSTIESEKPGVDSEEPEVPNYENNNTFEDETGGYDEWVEEEIPNTGSSKAVGGVIALGVIAAGALLLVKKRKSNEEQIGG